MLGRHLDELQVGVEIMVPQEVAPKLAKGKEKEAAQEGPQKGVSVHPSRERIAGERHKNKSVAGIEDWIVPSAKKTTKVTRTPRAFSSSDSRVNLLSVDAIDSG